MARRKRSTRKGQFRKTSRRAYSGLKRRTRPYRKRAVYAVRRRASRAGTGLLKGRSGRALMDCAWITGGGALGLAAGRFMPDGYMGMSSGQLVGAAALGWGIYRNDSKSIYLGFGALYPTIQRQMAGLIG